MRKTNLFKVIVCGLMLTAVVGTTGLAATRALVQVDDGSYVLDVEFYYDELDGTYGKFITYGETDSTELKVVNNNSAPRSYYIEVFEVDAYLNNVTRSDYSHVVLNPGGNETVYVSRDYDNPRYNYLHNGKSYYSTTSTSVVIDNYKCTLKQYK